ncbi:MAG TPA: universal stress protein [Ramlibacter sp.]|nr:universal stress protein [Ramlibacter sp.]
MFKRILVPVDGSETSDKAVVTALQMAREERGQVRLFHSLNEMAYFSAYEYSGEVIKYAREEGRRVLASAMAMAQSAGVAAEQELADAPGLRLGDSVARDALQWKADLIVVGSHGRRGLERALLGSGAEQIVRSAPVPVLVVRGDTGSRPG